MIEHFLKVIAKSKILGQMDHPNAYANIITKSYSEVINKYMPLKQSLSYGYEKK